MNFDILIGKFRSKMQTSKHTHLLSCIAQTRLGISMNTFAL